MNDKHFQYCINLHEIEKWIMNQIIILKKTRLQKYHVMKLEVGLKYM